MSKFQTAGGVNVQVLEPRGTQKNFKGQPLDPATHVLVLLPCGRIDVMNRKNLREVK